MIGASKSVLEVQWLSVREFHGPGGACLQKTVVRDVFMTAVTEALGLYRS